MASSVATASRKWPAWRRVIALWTVARGESRVARASRAGRGLPVSLAETAAVSFSGSQSPVACQKDCLSRSSLNRPCRPTS